jgi:selenoprotein W-related protein
MNVTITYCGICGYTPRALSLAEKILNEHDEDLDALTLVPTDGGVFDVEVDGQLVFSMHRKGRFPDYEDDLARFLGAA